MLIDWFTVGAQALNFLILVWLMKHFLYKPVQDAIAAREKRIADELADADAKRPRRTRTAKTSSARTPTSTATAPRCSPRRSSDANADRQRLLDVARKAADAMAAKREQTLQADAERLNESCVIAQQEVFAIARRTWPTWPRLASKPAHVRRVHAAPAGARRAQGRARRSARFGDGPAARPQRVHAAAATARRRPACDQRDLFNRRRTAVRVAPDLVGGIELSARGINSRGAFPTISPRWIWAWANC